MAAGRAERPGLCATFVDTLVRPRRAIAGLAGAPSLRQAAAATALFGGLYSVAALTSYAVGRRPRGSVLTFVPASRYYRRSSAPR